MRKIDLAWAAGILDGEGCISIVRHRPTPGTRCLSPRFILHVRVAMGHRPTLERLGAIFGHGTVQKHEPKSERANASFVWVAQQRKAETVLRLVRPYLVTKAAEADVALQFMKLRLSNRGGHGGSGATDEKLFADRERLWDQLRRLKPRWRFRPEASAPRLEAQGDE